MNDWTGEISEIERIAREVKSGSRIISISGLTSTAAKAFALSRVQEGSGKTFVIVAESNRDLESFESDLNFWKDLPGSVESRGILSFPSFETEIYSGVSPHADTLERRALALWQLSRTQPDFLIVTARSLAGRIVPPNQIENQGAVLKRDEEFSPDELIERLVSAGYVREDPLTNVGQFSMRGGIIDVWSSDAANPVRIEFFGDTVDSIREFYPETQLSTQQLREVAIAPMREFGA